MNEIYWVWLKSKKNVRRTAVDRLIMMGFRIRDIYEMHDYSQFDFINKSTAEQLMDKSLDLAMDIVKRVTLAGAYTVTIDDEEYPPILKNIFQPPLVLYMKGKHLRWNELFTVGVVGTRNYTPEGRALTDKLAGDLAEAGCTIVSGMAKGIDAISACAALERGADTIAVLGTGIDVVYPKQHKRLYDKIAENGVVISEYPPGTRGSKWSFPQRNRIIAGLSNGILVTQASLKSGTMSTANHAVKACRPVFAVAANPMDKSFEGCVQLVQNGANVVFSANDILKVFPNADLKPIPHVDLDENIRLYDKLVDCDRPTNEVINNGVSSENDTENKSEKTVDLNDFSGIEREIMEQLMQGTSHIDEIVRTLGRTSSEVNVALVMLELKGVVKKLESNNFVVS